MSSLEEEVRELKKIVENLVEEVRRLKEEKGAGPERKAPPLVWPDYLGDVMEIFEERLGDKPDAGLVFIGGIERRRGRISDSYLSVLTLDEVVECPPKRIVGIVSPFSNENRVRIMQVLLEGPKTSSELSRETGLEGGQLYHHLKDLMLAGYVEAVGRGKYALTSKGCMAIRTVAGMASIPGFAVPGEGELEAPRG